MQRVLRYLAADYTRAVTEYRIERLTFRLMPLGVVVVWASEVWL